MSGFSGIHKAYSLVSGVVACGALAATVKPMVASSVLSPAIAGAVPVALVAAPAIFVATLLHSAICSPRMNQALGFSSGMGAIALFVGIAKTGIAMALAIKVAAVVLPAIFALTVISALTTGQPVRRSAPQSQTLADTPPAKPLPLAKAGKGSLPPSADRQPHPHRVPLPRPDADAASPLLGASTSSLDSSTSSSLDSSTSSLSSSIVVVPTTSSPLESSFSGELGVGSASASVSSSTLVVSASPPPASAASPSVVAPLPNSVSGGDPLSPSPSLSAVPSGPAPAPMPVPEEPSLRAVLPDAPPPPSLPSPSAASKPKKKHARVDVAAPPPSSDASKKSAKRDISGNPTASVKFRITSRRVNIQHDSDDDLSDEDNGVETNHPAPAVTKPAPNPPKSRAPILGSKTPPPARRNGSPLSPILASPPNLPPTTRGGTPLPIIVGSPPPSAKPAQLPSATTTTAGGGKTNGT